MTLKSDITNLWGEEQEKSFHDVREALTGDLVLALADKSKVFYLHVDASGTGVGGCLYQEVRDQMRVVAYASRGLNRSEQNYPAHKREFLALKWAMSDKFCDYLLGSKTIVVTENNPLCYILKSAKLDATSHRWLASLSRFEFELKYKKGNTHIDADALSRIPHGPMEEDEQYKKTLEDISFLVEKAKKFDQSDIVRVDSNSVQAIIQSVQVEVTCSRDTVSDKGRAGEEVDEADNEQKESFVPAAEQIVRNPDLIPDDVLDPKGVVFDSVSPEQWRDLQLKDKTLRVVIQTLEAGELLKSVNLYSLELKGLAREEKRLAIRDGVLQRRVTEENSVRWQLVLPQSHRERALVGVHEDLFHTHLENGLAQLRLRFFWPYMARDLERKIRGCSRCIKRGAHAEKAPMHSVVTTFPLEVLSIDFLTIEVNGRKENILVVMDCFTKFAAAFCTRDQTAKTVARTLWNEFFMVYGFPKRILSDQGQCFEARLIQELCQVSGVEKIHTTPFTPRANMVERLNRTLLNMLRSLEEEQKSEWKKSLPQVVHAYNCCFHQSTGYSPYFLFFGRHPRLPIDVSFGVDINSGKSSTCQYVSRLKEQLGGAYTKARENMRKMCERNKVRYDESAHAANLEIGDRVLVRRLGHRVTSGKISDKWENDVYVVIGKSAEVPVYTVQVERGQGPKRTLHRNYLLPIGMLDMSVEGKPIPKPKKRGVVAKGKQKVIDINPRRSLDNICDYSVEDVEVQVAVDEVSRIATGLRPEAPEWVPQVLGDCDTVESMMGENLPPLDMKNKVSGEQEASLENIVEGGQSGLSDHKNQSADSDPLCGSHLDALTSHGGGAPGESERVAGLLKGDEDVELVALENEQHEAVTKDQAGSGPPVPKPRRSMRTRKPVDKLCLPQMCELEGCDISSNQRVDRGLLQSALERLGRLMNEEVGSGEKIVLERGLKGIMML